MRKADREFWATKDLDIVLCAEAIDAAFIGEFWKFIEAGGYRNRGESSGDKQFYRFDKPTETGFPFMLELFSRKPDQLSITDNACLTPIPADDEGSHLSAILLSDDYYQCIQSGRIVIDGVPVLSAEYILSLQGHGLA